MANDYFNHVANRVQAGTRAIAANVNDVADEISTGLDKLPTEAELKEGRTRYAVDAGAADAYVVALPYTPTLTDGFNFMFRPVNANTGASTINVNGLGAKSIVNADGSALTANSLSVESIAQLSYESVNGRFILVSQNPSFASASAASAAAASASESNAATSESNAATSESNALASENAAASSYDSFDDRYLGAKASDPTLDNDGNALITGALYWNSTTDIMKAWDGAAWQTVFAAGDAATLGGFTSSQYLRDDAANSVSFNSASTFLDIRLSGAGIGLDIRDESAGAGGQLGFLYSNNASRSVPLLDLTQDNAAALAQAIAVQQDGDGTAIDVTTSGDGVGVKVSANGADHAIQAAQLGTGRGVYITHTGTNGVALDVNGNNASRTNAVAQITQDHASSTAVALNIQQDGTGDALNIDAVNAAATAIRAYSNIATRTQPLVEIINDNATGFGEALKIQQDAAGSAIDISCTNTGAATQAINSSYAGTSSGHRFVSTSATQTGANLIASTSGLNNAASFTSNNASRALSSATVVISDQNAGSSGDSLYINHAPTNANSRGIDLNIPGTSNASVGILVTHSGTGTGTGVYALLSGSGDAFLGTASGTAGTAGRFTATAASRTQPVVEIINDNATGSGLALLVQQDQSAPHIELSGANGEGIKFPATANVSTDVNTLDDYQEGTYTATLTTGTSGTITLSSTLDTLSYTKIGRIVFLQGWIQVSSISSPVGAVSLNLPFDAVDEAEVSERAAAAMACYGLTNGTLPAHPMPMVEIPAAGGANATLVMHTLDTSGQTAFEGLVAAGTVIRLNFHYHTDE